LNILVINGGSSSLKYQLYDMDSGAVIAKGVCERIGMDGSILTHKAVSKGTEHIYREAMPDHTAAITLVFNALTAAEGGVISALSDIDAVGHRVLHGGDKFTASAVVTEEVLRAIRDCIPLGPLHNPANLAGIEACRKLMPGTPQVAVFDTAFHQTMPPKAYMYAIPYEYYEKYGVKLRRYGFHGSSHRYVSAKAAEFLGRENDPNFKVVVAHLGNGSSFSACLGGKCQDTSMGLTPLEGIPMGTRSGSIDPAILQFIMNRDGLDINAIVDGILNKRSGMLGVSGVSSDFRDLEAAQSENNDRAALALDIFKYDGKKLVASYVAVLGGADAIVFTAGIGENDSAVREGICEGLEFMGAKLDKEKNNDRSNKGARDISAADSKVRILVIPTDEEFVIASDTKELTEKR
jgi:acetate kinase